MIREDLLSKITHYVAGAHNSPLVFVSDSGGGKTALISKWVADRRESHPNEFMFVHYPAASGLTPNDLSNLCNSYSPKL